MNGDKAAKWARTKAQKLYRRHQQKRWRIDYIQRLKVEGRCTSCHKKSSKAETGHTLCLPCLQLRRVKHFELKVEVLKQYGGPRCICCGVTELKFLTLDHVNDDGNAHRKSLGMQAVGGGYYAWLKRNGFPDEIELQVLCWNCQWGKRLGGCPHGPQS